MGNMATARPSYGAEAAYAPLIITCPPSGRAPGGAAKEAAARTAHT